MLQLFIYCRQWQRVTTPYLLRINGTSVFRGVLRRAGGNLSPFQGIWRRYSGLAARYRTTLHDVPDERKSSQPPCTPITWLHIECNSPLPCTSRIKSRSLRDPVNWTLSISQFSPTCEPPSRVSMKHTRTHTWNRSVANWHTAEYLWTRHQRGSGSRRWYEDGLCLSRLIIKSSEVIERPKKKKLVCQCITVFAQTFVKRQWLATHGWQGDTYNSGPVQTVLGAHPAACKIGIRSLYWGVRRSGPGVVLTTHPI